ncbi:DUF6414 family protein [Ruminococcus sp.]|uniref:DUF6414 family protein n=1 Tax=Ruminococcus sp. TaxID=41978 RepID=UPI002E76BD55|nr:DUF6414 family protein [Ruminococcus sp.]MEE1264357.1 DUF6414 family protein [Ruminococcus sp.]
MKENKINKIIYFDKETIQNILQEQNKGEKSKNTNLHSSIKSEGDVELSAKVDLNLPFFKRLGFLFSGKIESGYLVQRDSTTTLSSTEISEFEGIKEFFTEEKNVTVQDIENSSTSLRLAAGYLRIVKNSVEEVDTKEFLNVMDKYDGYDTYKISENKYVRFNSKAFVSNYKRNDLLTTIMTLYCIPVGKFAKERFDFIREMEKMEKIFSHTNQSKSLSDIYPPKNDETSVEPEKTISNNDLEKSVELFDVVYACISQENKNE